MHWKPSVALLPFAFILSACPQFESSDYRFDETEPSEPVGECQNDVLDSNIGETDLDCGGPCPPCELGLTCILEQDCISGRCESLACVQAPLVDAGPDDPCENGQLDAKETDIDCGGKKCAPCELGQTCDDKGDCADGLECKDDVCVDKDD